MYKPAGAVCQLVASRDAHAETWLDMVHELAQRDQIIAEQCRTQEVYERMIDGLEKQNEQLNKVIVKLLRKNERQIEMIMLADEVLNG